MGCSSSTESTMDSKSMTLLTAPASGSKAKIVMTPETQATSVKANVAVPEGKASVDVTKLLNEIFDQLDTNGDGFVSRKELSSSLDHVLECSHVESEKSFRTLLAESHLNPYLSTFEQLDTNHDGKISREEFQANMHPSKAAKNVEQHLKDIFDRIDTNKNGELCLKEFSKAFNNNLLTKSCLKSGKNFKTLMIDAGLNPDVFSSEENCDAATTTFQALDANNDGTITWEAFRSKLQPAFDSMEFLRSVFNQMDANGDGTVSKEELTVSFERILDCSEMKSKKSFRILLQEAGLNAEFYVFEELDTNADGRITWDEFEASLKPVAPQPDTKESVAKQAAAEDFLSETEGKTDVVLEGDEASASATCFCGGW